MEARYDFFRKKIIAETQKYNSNDLDDYVISLDNKEKSTKMMTNNIKQN